MKEVATVKIVCRCGALVVDQTDDLPHKAHLVPDQEWFEVLDAIAAAIATAGPAPEDRQEAGRRAQATLMRVSRPVWQCRECGRLWVDDQRYELQEFLPATDEVRREILRSRKSPNDTGSTS